MPDLSSRSIKRIADVVRQVEGDSQFPSMMQDVRGGGYSPELRAVRITSVTLDGDGLYPAQLIEADTSADPSAWTDTTECRVQALSGDLAVGRLWAARVGETAAGLPIFSPVGSNSTSTKRYVRAATTANITLSGAQTIDGVSIAVGEDVLVKDQSTTADNGIYTAASSTWARRADADSWDELVGALVVVTEGTTLADTLWMCTSNAGGTLGSTSVTWAQVGGSSGSYIEVDVATLVAGTLASDFAAAATIDSVVIPAGARILIKDQAAPAENGIYVAGLSGAPIRATDSDSWAELAGALVLVRKGTRNAGTLWNCTSADGGTLESTAVTYRQVSGPHISYDGDVLRIDNPTRIEFDGTDEFVITEPSAGVVRIAQRVASISYPGIVSTSSQSWGGQKSSPYNSGPDYGFVSALFGVSEVSYTNATYSVESFNPTYGVIGVPAAGVASGHISFVDVVDPELNLSCKQFAVRTLQSFPGESADLVLLHATRILYGVGEEPHDPFYFCAFANATHQGCVPVNGDYYADDGGSWYKGASATVSGLVFKSGLYISGSLSVTVSPGDITGLDEAIDDRVAALLVEGTGIDLTYDDGAGTITIACTITQYTDEMARDAIGTALTAGTGIAITPNDGADTITVALSFLGLEALADPGADRIAFWDDSAGAFAWLTLGSGLSITTTTLTATGSITGPGSSTDNAIVRWDGTGGTAIQNSTALVNDDGSLDVNSTIAATNSTDEILHLHQACSGGTPAAGFGAVVVIHLADDGSSDAKAMAWATYWVDATHASRKSRWVLSAADAGGEREIMRGEASGSAPMLGFLGANAAIRQTGDVGTAMVTFGLMSGTPTFAWANLSSVPTASDTASGIVELAIQSEMETATDTTRAVVPGRVQYHPGVCKGWVNFSATGGTVTSLASHNVSSITDGGVGNYTINWNTDFSGTAYAVLGTASYVDGSATDVFIETHISFSAGSTQVYALSYDAGTLTDTTLISIVAFGDQA